MNTAKHTNLEISLDIEAMKAPVIKKNTVFVVGISGGKDSAATLLWMIYESGVARARIKATFADTGNEHTWTYGHIKKLAGLTGVEIETLRPERDFFALALYKRRFPSVKARFCTQCLKIYPSQQCIQRLRYWGLDPISVSGVRADESPERAGLPEWSWSKTLNCPQWRPLLRWTLDDVKAIHARHNIPLNPLYAIGAHRVGCWPCIMSRKTEIRTIALKFPERITEIRNAENKFEQDYGRYSSFFAASTIPERFRSKPYTLPDGTAIKVATIDDIVRWSMTGKRAQGGYLNNSAKEPITCSSGFCE
ncbi:phosphoadenosine phosphosulfate reductase family protein [Termitidicoccus mucosus]